MIEYIEMLHKILESGLTWSTATAVLLGILRILDRRREKREREESRQNQIRILDTLGIPRYVPTGKSGLLFIRRKRSYSCLPCLASSRAGVVIRYTHWKGGIHMQNPINWTSLTITVLGAAKIVLEAFNVDVINDDLINNVANGVAAVATIVGVLMSHRKQQSTVIQEPYDAENMV